MTALQWKRREAKVILTTLSWIFTITYGSSNPHEYSISAIHNAQADYLQQGCYSPVIRPVGLLGKGREVSGAGQEEAGLTTKIQGIELQQGCIALSGERNGCISPWQCHCCLSWCHCCCHPVQILPQGALQINLIPWSTGILASLHSLLWASITWRQTCIEFTYLKENPCWQKNARSESAPLSWWDLIQICLFLVLCWQK